MNKFFYSKLALNNIKKNSRTYFPYILTCICTIAMFYIMSFLSTGVNFPTEDVQEVMGVILNLGVYVIGIFSVIFLFYTNSFLIKNRKKEFGLFNILGMEKKHILKILLLETTFISFISLITGLALGIVLSKSIFLLLLKILGLNIQMGFQISLNALVSSIVLFIIIFAIIFLNSFRQIHLTNPIELLKGGQVGEKEPKTKWLMTIIGFVCLFSGYYISVTTDNAIESLSSFFIAVILVIIGTYALFMAGSIAILKMLRKNKRIYYKSNNFISISGMIYRMKQNAAGLANICILSTMVLVMLSTTVSLFIGVEDSLRRNLGNDIVVSVETINADTDRIDSIIEKEVKSYNGTIENKLSFKYSNTIAEQNGNKFSGNDLFFQQSSNLSQAINFMIISVGEYNKLEKTNITLKDDEILLYSNNKKNTFEKINFNNIDFKVKANLKSLSFVPDTSLVSSYAVVTANENIIKNIKANDKNSTGALSYHYSFDTNIDKESQKKLTKSLSASLEKGNVEAYVDGLEDKREGFNSVYGGLFFLGIFLGTLFVMATVLIIYYKQISEGYDDRKRFEIMKKVGMSDKEIKKSIHSQVLMVFFIPLITSCIHVAFAFNVINKLLVLLVLENTKLFIMCTIGTILVFTILYAIVYSLTAKVYYKIVSSN